MKFETITNQQLEANYTYYTNKWQLIISHYILERTTAFTLKITFKNPQKLDPICNTFCEPRDQGLCLSIMEIKKGRGKG